MDVSDSSRAGVPDELSECTDCAPHDIYGYSCTAGICNEGYSFSDGSCLGKHTKKENVKQSWKSRMFQDFQISQNRIWLESRVAVVESSDWILTHFVRTNFRWGSFIFQSKTSYFDYCEAPIWSHYIISFLCFLVFSQHCTKNH